MTKFPGRTTYEEIFMVRSIRARPRYSVLCNVENSVNQERYHLKMMNERIPIYF
jgi:hypothetical protein